MTRRAKGSTSGRSKSNGRSGGAGRSKTGKRSKGRQKGSPPSRSSAVLTFVGCVALGAIGVSLVPEAPETVTDGAEQVVWNGARVRVEVQNGGGVTGMAQAATERLRPAGFDVVKYGNASSFDPDRVSVVIDHVGRSEYAQAVAETLGIDNVQSDPNPNLYVDVTVVLGREWTGSLSGQANDVGGGLPWWDPRDWFDF